MALRATKGDEDAVAAGRRFRCFFAGSSTGRRAMGMAQALFPGFPKSPGGLRGQEVRRCKTRASRHTARRGAINAR
jgi:hypothetical protein